MCGVSVHGRGCSRGERLCQSAHSYELCRFSACRFCVVLMICFWRDECFFRLFIYFCDCVVFGKLVLSQRRGFVWYLIVLLVTVVFMCDFCLVLNGHWCCCGVKRYLINMLTQEIVYWPEVYLHQLLSIDCRCCRFYSPSLTVALYAGNLAHC